MRALTADELARMQSTQVGAMMDACVLMRYGSVTDMYGNPKPTWTDEADETACGLELVRPGQTMGEGLTPTFDARLRLPIETTIDPRDRVRVTGRFGAELATAETYVIVGNPRRGPSGLYLDLKRHMGGTYE